MIEFISDFLFPQENSFTVTLLVLTILSFIALAAAWIILIFCSKLVKNRLQHLAETTSTDTRFFSKLVLQHGKLLLTTFTTLKWAFTLYILLTYCASLLGIVVDNIQMRGHSANFKNAILYLDNTSLFFDKSATFLITVFCIVILAIWAEQLLQNTTRALMTRSEPTEHILTSERNKARRETLNIVTGNLLKIAVYVFATFSIMQNIGVNIATLLTTAGLASVAIGLGAQTLVKDFIGGFFILFEDQFAVGDQVEINSFSGNVERMTLRIVKLRSGEGSIVIIPNGEIRSLKNFTTDWARVDFKINLPFSVDFEDASRILQEELDKFKVDYKKRIIGVPEIRSVEKIADHENKSVSATFRVFIKTHSIANRISLEMEFNKRVIGRLHTEGLLPYVAYHALPQAAQTPESAPLPK